MTAWYDDDGFWETMEPFLFPQSQWDSASEQIDQALALAHVAPGAAILDLACGVGRHSLELARRGFRVTGVDRTAKYLECAKERARAESLSVEFVHQDMRAFRREGAFDAAVNLFTSFGYFEDPRDDRTVVENVSASLRPGGVFVMDLMGREALARAFTERDWRRLEDGTLVLEERRIENGWQRMVPRWIIVRDGEQREVSFPHRVYSASELKTLLISCGFAEARAYGHLSGIPYDHKAKRLVVVARNA